MEPLQGRIRNGEMPENGIKAKVVILVPLMVMILVTLMVMIMIMMIIMM